MEKEGKSKVSKKIEQIIANQRSRLVLALSLTGLLLMVIFCTCRSVEVISHGDGLPCFFNYLTGLSCPGCGNTRALIALTHGNFLKGLSTNLLYPLEFAYVLWVYFNIAYHFVVGRKFNYRGSLVDWLVLTLIVLWFPVRNILSL